MKKLLCLVLAVSMIHSTSYAISCPKPVTLLDQGVPAPCHGFLFSPEEEERVYLLDQNNKLLQQQLDLQAKYIESANKSLADFSVIVDREKHESELWRNAAVDATQKLVKEDDARSRRDFMMIGLGVLMTLASGFAVGYVATHH